MNKIIISSYGSGIAVGIEGEASFVERQINRFYNYGGMTKNGEFHKESDKFGFFLSSKESMISALSCENFVRFQMDGTSKLFKKNPNAMQNAADQDAVKQFNEFERENFMGRMANNAAKICGIASNGRAESWEEDFKPAK